MINEDDKKIVDEVLEDFAGLARIPRPSLHEKAVSDYLLGVFRALGCDVHQDAANNIVADRAASPGFENVPRVILQAHMDMVCVAAEGVGYDPLRDPIRLRREGGELTAEGTSLGADDGAGVAMIFYVFRHAKDVGPLRAIITTDEETGMTGAQALDGKYLADADFLINWDSEDYDELTRGCAGSVGVEFYRKADWREPPKGSAWRVSVGGLLGGHSGERIGDGRGNALRILAQTLHSLKNAGIAFSVASLTGGSARNAIAAEAEAV
ncbi:MAG: M20/M25/M40 family metallo-hydrolase, partial [Schwartzia sp.]|nr:M20/M25/M40 family metallo-hydrolase [Schwartzia sp. (in: firmicutes)]